MIVFPNAKINLGLNVLTQRSDGYHEIQSVFFPVPLTDVLEFVENGDSNQDIFSTSGIPIPGNSADNLCIKALALMRKVKRIPWLKIHLHKLIPLGAGLGGGSSDGTWFLRSLNDEFEVGLGSKSLKILALELGSDCPFFIENIPVAVSGKGEVLTELHMELTGFYLLLIFSDTHISTASAYRAMKPKSPDFLPSEVIRKLLIEEWKEKLTNDFEFYAFAQYPVLEKTKARLYDMGAVYASMTGSGSAIYGIFKSKPVVSPSDFPAEKIWLSEL